MSEASPTTTTPQRSFRPLRWFVRKIHLPLIFLALGLGFAGTRIVFGNPNDTGKDLLLRWGLFGLSYGFLVMMMRLLEEVGFGNKWTAMLAPVLGLVVAWQGYGVLIGPDFDIVNFFLLAAVATLLLSPLCVIMWRIFFR